MKKTVLAMMDFEMGTGLSGTHLGSLVEADELDPELIDASVRSATLAEGLEKAGFAVIYEKESGWSAVTGNRILIFFSRTVISSP